MSNTSFDHVFTVQPENFSSQTEISAIQLSDGFMSEILEDSIKIKHFSEFPTLLYRRPEILAAI